MSRGLALAAVVGLACAKDGRTVVDVKVELAHRAAEGAVLLLRATVEDLAGHRAMHDFAKPDGTPLTFPTTFGIELSRGIDGPIRIEVRAIDRNGTTVAQGSIEAQPITPGTVHNARLWLECTGNCPQPDAGTDARPGDAGRDAPETDALASCGNGKRDPGEACDIAIATGRPGACPSATCDDNIACTVDTRIGSGCAAACSHFEIGSFVPGDGCCPRDGTHKTDPDCSATCGNATIEAGETCDLGIPADKDGACPAGSTCADDDPCTLDYLLSANTCAARCSRSPITAFVAGDRCCPEGATHMTDPDCPVVCGNAIVETGERCDTGIPAGMPMACPTTCNDNVACTADLLEGSGCQAICRRTPITQFVGGDGCCPEGGNRNLDPDCVAECGNGAAEPGEGCDKAIAAGRPGACPSTCTPDPSGCMPGALEGNAAECSARCVPQPITMCSREKDGCCPAGCSANSDMDCSPTCGNGVKETGETCDTAIPEPLPGSCPRRCDDMMACTTEMLLSSGTCNARCQFTEITAYVSGDGCCPPRGNHNLDGDCPFVCGNGVVEGPKETCDRMIPEGMAGGCPTSCPGPSNCRKPKLEGEATMCTSRCELEPITACQPGDGCCPTSCNRTNDADCPAECGNAVVEMGEACDKGLTAGNVGACPATCDDADACTVDTTSGRPQDCTRVCTYAPITACAAGDRCCPTGCTPMTDSDCAPVCGNNVVEAGETCDPGPTCPTMCMDDGDLCTAEKLTGAPMTCNVACGHMPITACSGAMADRCCPTGCLAKPNDPKFDTDCAGSTMGPMTPGP